MSDTDAGTVVFLSGDLMFASRVRGGAEHASLKFYLGGNLPTEGHDTIKFVILDLSTRSKLIETLQETLGGTLPSVLGALGILVLGWFVAMAVRAGVRKGLGIINVNLRLRSTTGAEMDIEGGTAAGVYYLILLLVLVAFFNALHLELVSGPLRPLVGQVLAFVPKLVAGGF